MQLEWLSSLEQQLHAIAASASIQVFRAIGLKVDQSRDLLRSGRVDR